MLHYPSRPQTRAGGRFHLVRGNTTWLGSDGPPLVYDDYDKNCYMSWGAHTVVLPMHGEGFGDFYGKRALDPGVGRMDVRQVDWKPGQPANVVIPGAIDLPAYHVLLQPSVQKALNLSEEQRIKLQDISAKYWPERRQIAGKELADMESASQKELAVKCAKARSRACLVKQRRGQLAFFQRGCRQIGAAMEQRPQTDRRCAYAPAVAYPQGPDLPHIRVWQRIDV